MTNDDQDYLPYSLGDDNQTTAQQLASLVSPADAASLVAPAASGANTSTSSAPAAVMSPAAGAQPSAATSSTTALPAAYSSGRAALQSIGPPPQQDMAKVQQLQQQVAADGTLLNRADPKYKAGLGQKILRGIAATMTGGIPAAITTDYNAPNRQYGIDNNARLNRLAQDQTQLGNVNKNYEDQIKGYKDATAYATAVNRADTNDNTGDKNAQQHAAFNAAHGLKDVTDPVTGKVTSVDDPDSETFRGRKITNDLRETTETLKQAQTDALNADPKTPAGRLAVAKVKAAEDGHNAAMMRAQAYMGNYLMHSKGVDAQGNTLAGATELPDNTPVGTAFQPVVQKQQPKVAQFNDVHGALDSLESAAKNLVKSGGKLNSPGVAAAMADPQSTSSQYLQGLVAKGQLTPAERDYVIANAAAHENLMALRSSVGGGVSDSQVHQLLSLLPNASTPDLDYALRQTGQIRQTATRLGSGIANVHGGTRVRGSQPETPAAPPSQGGPIPAAAAAQLKEGVVHTFGNGQQWTKKNGVPVRLK
jgi:hypothetical protein